MKKEFIMLKTLLASTALTALITTSAMAASHSENNEMQNDAAMQNEASMQDDATTMGGQNTLYSQASLASDVIGSAIYESAAEDADMIGDVNNIVIGPDGEVLSVVVGVGGFLGIGEKDVEVDYRTIQWVDRDGERWLVANMNREQLESAPVFDRDAVYTEARSGYGTRDLNEAGDVAANNPATPATGDTDAADATAERVDQGGSAVGMAENQTTGIDRESMTPVSSEQLSADNLMGQTVYGASDEDLGDISDVLLTSDNQVEAFIIDVGGFLGMGEKPVAISPENLDIRSNADGDLTVFTSLTQSDLESQQEYSQETYEADPSSVILIVPAR